jgi:hypothetical protein
LNAPPDDTNKTTNPYSPFYSINKEHSSKNSKQSTNVKENSNVSDNKQTTPEKESSRWWILFPLIAISFIVMILSITNFSLFDCQQLGYTITQSQSFMSLAPIGLDRSKYSTGQIVHINSSFKNNDNSQLAETYVEINRTHFPSSIPGCYKPFTLSDQDTFALIKLDKTKYNYTFMPNQPGLYVISTYNNSSQHKEFKTIFEVINPTKSTTFVMLIIAIGFFIALVLLCYILSIKSTNLNNEKLEKKQEITNAEDNKKQIENKSLSNDEKSIKNYNEKYFKILKEKYQRELLEKKYQSLEENYRIKMADYIEIAGSYRFIFISAFVWSIIFAFVFTEVEIGTHSPLGLVIRHNLNPGGGELDVTNNPLIDWGINIGGNWENNFSSGVVIPVYVFILGFIGGYLRYLHKAASKERVSPREPIVKGKEIDKGIETEYTKKSVKPLESTSSEFQETTYGELSHIFLAPLLAAVVWFIISRGQTDFNIYGMAAISFSIGLVTTEIIQIIVKFMERIIPAEKNI